MKKQLQRQRSRKEVRATTAQEYKNSETLERENFARMRDASSAFYAGIDPRRRKEVADAGMVQEDHSKMANLSDRFIHREYPRFGEWTMPFIDDTELV